MRAIYGISVAMMLSVVVSLTAVSKTQAQTIADGIILPNHRLLNIVRAVYDRQAIIRGAWVYGEFSDGGSNDLPTGVVFDAQGQAQSMPDSIDILIVPGSSPLRYDRKYGGHNPKISATNNAALRLDRGRWFNEQIDDRGFVYGSGIANDRKVVYMLAVERTHGAPPPPTNIERVIEREVVTTLWLRPSVGLGLVVTQPTSTFAPGWGFSIGTYFGKRAVGVYAYEGQDFQSDTKGWARYGLQYGEELGLAFRVGYLADWTEFRGVGDTSRRREGGEFGVSYGWPVVTLAGSLGGGWYSDLGDRGGSFEPSVNMMVQLGPRYINR